MTKIIKSKFEKKKNKDKKSYQLRVWVRGNSDNKNLKK